MYTMAIYGHVDNIMLTLHTILILSVGVQLYSNDETCLCLCGFIFKHFPLYTARQESSILPSDTTEDDGATHSVLNTATLSAIDSATQAAATAAVMNAVQSVLTSTVDEAVQTSIAALKVDKTVE